MKKVVLLKHIKDQDEKILGVFDSEKIEIIIKYYLSLPGFCDCKIDSFHYTNSIYTDKNFIYLLQIWNEDEDDVSLFEKMFTSKSEAKTYMENFIAENGISKKDYLIEKYDIGQKYWIEGFFSV